MSGVGAGREAGGSFTVFTVRRGNFTGVGGIVKSGARSVRTPAARTAWTIGDQRRTGATIARR